MKKSVRSALFLLVLFSVCSLCAKQTHTLYLIRHGQVNDPKCLSPKFQNGTREQALTKLGVEQAKRVGAYLKRCRYTGPIYASPLYRAMQTASYICDALNTKFTIEPDLQEHTRRGHGEKGFMAFGCNQQEFIKYFPRCIVPEGFPNPWRLDNESEEERSERVEKALDRLLAKHPGKLMFVSHGGTMTALRRILEKRGGKPKGFNWNCCLLIYKLDENGKVISCGYETDRYLPDSMQTDNLGLTKLKEQAKKSRKK